MGPFRLFAVFVMGWALWCLTTNLLAHPVPREAHDRTIVVHLSHVGSDIVATVNYRLEVDEWTVIIKDMVPFKDEVPLAEFRDKRLAYYGEYTRIYAPILARNLSAVIDAKEVEFICLKRDHTLTDEKGQALGHLRCDFVFQAQWGPERGDKYSLRFRENNFADQEGRIDVSLVADPSIRMGNKTEADAALKAKPATLWAPGDEKRLRQVEATFTLTDQPASSVVSTPTTSTTRPETGHDDSRLLHLFLSSEYAYWMLLLIAAGVGAVHALTPGHGKTLVAAYLVGQSGTVWHALLLGVVTTITHTGVVLILAFGLQWLYPLGMSASDRQNLQSGLGLFMGLAIVCLGFWLLLCRLSGRADHVHLGGDHHHPHGHGHHHHHPTSVPPEGVSTWGLLVLGMSGGIVPCWDAIAMLILAVGMNLLWMAVPLLLAFSLGLAGVLVLLGILVVRFRRFAGSHWGESRWMRALPIVSALLVTALGFWLCYDSLPASP